MNTQNPLSIIDLQDPRWLSFIQSRKDAVIFHHPAWISVLEKAYHYHPFILAHCTPSGEILAGLPVMEVKSMLTGKRWVSLPFSDYCNPLAVDPAALEEFTNRLAELGAQPETPQIQLRWQFPSSRAITSYQHHVLHLNHLSPDFEEVFNKIQKRMRTQIRKMEKSDMHVEIGTQNADLKQFYQLQLETRRRHGLPIQPYKFFDLLGTHVLGKGLGLILKAYMDDRLLAGIVLLHFQNTATIKFVADTRDTGNLRPNYLTYNSAIRWAHENGYQTIDYGRSAVHNQGLRDFKSRFGADEQPLIYSVIGGEPPDATDGKLMTVMQAVIHHSPGFVCKAAGEMLYRHIG